MRYQGDFVRLRVVVWAGLALLKAGCASLFNDPYAVTLVDRNSGATGVGKAPRGWSPGGQVEVALNGRTYEGRWFHIPSSEAVLVDRWGEPGRWDDPVREREMTGTAEMLLIAGEDDKLRCQLRFNLRAHRGTGACKALTGGIYDLRFVAR
jgi:hypothetical protein